MTAAVEAFEAIVRAGTALTRAQAAELLTDPDLVSVGVLGEQARKAITGDKVSFGRVLLLPPGANTPDTAEIEAAGEIRLMDAGSSADDAIARVRETASHSKARCLTGFTLRELLDLSGNDHLALADLAGALKGSGLDAVADAPIDLLGDTDNVVEVIRAVLHGGLAVRRATIAAAAIDARLDLIERAVRVQAETSALAAFAPLPRQDPATQPATGYDDVRTIAAARLMARNIRLIQVDWPLYGPKLAQVAIAYGANDIDGVATADALNLGHRRSPKEDIERQIRAAAAEPVERDGRYEDRL